MFFLVTLVLAGDTLVVFLCWLVIRLLVVLAGDTLLVLVLVGYTFVSVIRWWFLCWLVTLLLASDFFGHFRSMLIRWRFFLFRFLILRLAGDTCVGWWYLWCLVTHVLCCVFYWRLSDQLAPLIHVAFPEIGQRSVSSCETSTLETLLFPHPHPANSRCMYPNRRLPCVLVDMIPTACPVFCHTSLLCFPT